MSKPRYQVAMIATLSGATTSDIVRVTGDGLTGYMTNDDIAEILNLAADVTDDITIRLIDRPKLRDKLTRLKALL